jgi:hypothetical protein
LRTSLSQRRFLFTDNPLSPETPMRLIVISGADESNGAGLIDLAASLTAVRGEMKFTAGCLDHGMAEPTRERLAPHFDTIVRSRWPFRPHFNFDRQPQALDAAARPFLPDYFPGFDAYVWIDPWNFVQGGRGLEILASACANGFAGTVPALDRSYNHSQESIVGVFARFRMAFGKDAAVKLLSGPYTTSNVVAASASSPLWALWRSRFQSALDRWEGPALCAEAVLNHVIRTESLPHHRLPSLCSWQSNLALPQIDVAQGVFVEPSYPFDPIHIVANSFAKKDQPRTFARHDGGTATANLSFKGLSAALAADGVDR